MLDEDKAHPTRTIEEVARHYAANRDARWKQEAEDRRQLADERAREFWEKACLRYIDPNDTDPQDVDVIVHTADHFTDEWRQRFAPPTQSTMNTGLCIHGWPSHTCAPCSEKTAIDPNYALLGEAVDIIATMRVAHRDPALNFSTMADIYTRADHFSSKHQQAREDWRKSR